MVRKTVYHYKTLSPSLRSLTLYSFYFSLCHKTLILSSVVLIASQRKHHAIDSCVLQRICKVTHSSLFPFLTKGTYDRPRFCSIIICKEIWYYMVIEYLISLEGSRIEQKVFQYQVVFDLTVLQNHFFSRNAHDSLQENHLNNVLSVLYFPTLVIMFSLWWHKGSRKQETIIYAIHILASKLLSLFIPNM